MAEAGSGAWAGAEAIADAKTGRSGATMETTPGATPATENHYDTAGGAARSPTATAMIDEFIRSVDNSGTDSTLRPSSHDVILLLKGGQYVFVDAVADLFEDGSVMAHDSLVVLADGRVQTSRGLVQAIGDASGVEYESTASLRRAAADWSQSIFCDAGNLVDGMELTYEDDDEMPRCAKRSNDSRSLERPLRRTPRRRRGCGGSRRCKTTMGCHASTARSRRSCTLSGPSKG